MNVVRGNNGDPRLTERVLDAGVQGAQGINALLRVKQEGVELVFNAEIGEGRLDLTGRPALAPAGRPRQPGAFGVDMIGDFHRAPVRIGLHVQVFKQRITAIVKLLRAELPQTKVLILGIFPRGETPNPQRDKNAKANELAMKLADGRMIHYMDIGQHFLEPDGTLTKEIMPDFLHLTPKGYHIWAIAIEGKLRELLGEKP